MGRWRGKELSIDLNQQASLRMEPHHKWTNLEGYKPHLILHEWQQLFVAEHSHTTRFEQTISGIGRRIYCSYYRPGKYDKTANFAWICYLISLGVQKMWNAFAQRFSFWCWSKRCMWHVPCHGGMNEERTHSVSQTTETETRDMGEFIETSVPPAFQRDSDLISGICCSLAIPALSETLHHKISEGGTFTLL